MGLVYNWHIHREGIFTACGIVLCMASMVIVLSTSHHGGSSHEVSLLMAAAFRNVLAGLALVTLVSYIWRRVYWRERARWSRISPEGAALAGLVALALALALGGPETAASLQPNPQ